MNAPANVDHLADPKVEVLPLASITLSETHVQQLRRQKYDPAALEELAASIRENGVLMPILVRPLEAMRGLAKFELVAGERRYLAAEKAGQAHIVARILPLTDEQVLKAQLVENLHREGLDVLAEARGIRELMDQGVPATAIADMIGKSKSYVHARKQLLELAPAVQQALQNKEIAPWQALLFARAPTHKLQEHALKVVRTWAWAYQGHGEKLSFRRTAEIIGKKGKGLLIPLKRVPFSLTDEGYYALGPKHGPNEVQDMIPLPACTVCPKRSGNDAELLAAIDDPDVCTDKLCHDAKAKQEFERRWKEIEATGREVLTGAAAAEILPTQFGTRGYIDLDEPCDDDKFPEPGPKKRAGEAREALDERWEDWLDREHRWQPRTYREILGEAVAELEITLVQDPKNKSRLRELAPDKDVVRLLRAKGIKCRLFRDNRKPEKPVKPEDPKPEDPEKARRLAEKQAAEQAKAALEEEVTDETRKRVLEAMHEKWKGPLKRDDLELIAEFVLERMSYSEYFDRLYPKRPQPATLSERDLGRLLVCAIVTSELTDGWRQNADAPLKAVAKRLKIDPKAIEKEVRAELTPRDDTKPAAKKKAAKSKRK